MNLGLAIFRGEQLFRWTSSQESSARTIYLQKERKPAAVGSFPPVMDKLDEASDALKQKLYEKVKVALESGTELVSKRVEATD